MSKHSVVKYFERTARAWQQEARRRRRRCLAAARKIAMLLSMKFNARRVVLFGSMHTGRHLHDRSDLDMMVEGIAPDRFFRAYAEAADLSPVKLDLLAWEDSSAALRERVMKEGKIILEGVNRRVLYDGQTRSSRKGKSGRG